MTSAPPNLLAVRRLLLDQLSALDPASVGIVGDPAHRGGYHCGADRVLSEDYSVVESARDRTGLADWACALDVGDFTVTVGGKRHTLASFSVWLVAQCKAGTADTRDIREVIYSPDGVVVRRWDRLGKRTSGDSSHRWHTHISYHRDAIKAGRDQAPVFRRYLTYIGLIEAPIVEAPDMDATERAALLEVRDTLRKIQPDVWATTNRAAALLAGTDASYQIAGETTRRTEPNVGARALSALAGKDFTDEPAIVAGVLAGLTPEAIAAAIPTDMARQVADELAARLSG